MGTRSDIIIEIRPFENTQNISVNQYLTDLRFDIVVRSAHNPISRTISIPNSRDETIKGYGQTESASRANAFSLEWFGRQEAEFDRIEQVIREILM